MKCCRNEKKQECRRLSKPRVKERLATHDDIDELRTLDEMCTVNQSVVDMAR